MGLDAPKEPEFCPVDGDLVLVPTFGVQLRTDGGESECSLFKNVLPIDRIYRVSVKGGIYCFTRDGAQDPGDSGQFLDTPDHVFAAFDPSRRFPPAFSLPAALLRLVAQHDWMVISQEKAREIKSKVRSRTPPGPDVPAAALPAVRAVRAALPLVPLPPVPSEIDSSTALTALQVPQELAVRSVQDLSPEALVAHLETLVQDLEAVTLRRAADTIVVRAVQQAVGRLMPFAAQGHIIPALQTRLAQVQADLIAKNNAYDRAVKAARNPPVRVEMERQLRNLVEAVHLVGGLMVSIHESRQPAPPSFFDRIRRLFGQ